MILKILFFGILSFMVWLFLSLLNNHFLIKNLEEKKYQAKITHLIARETDFLSIGLFCLLVLNLFIKW